VATVYNKRPYSGVTAAVAEHRSGKYFEPERCSGKYWTDYHSRNATISLYY